MEMQLVGIWALTEVNVVRTGGHWPVDQTTGLLITASLLTAIYSVALHAIRKSPATRRAYRATSDQKNVDDRRATAGVRRLAADAIEASGASREASIEFAGIRDRYLPECSAHTKAQHHKSEFAIRAAAMIRAARDPDLLGEVAPMAKVREDGWRRTCGDLFANAVTASVVD